MQGAWLSLEQCGHLLRDAVLLFQQGRYASAVGLAMVARDELGKYKALLELWNRVRAGEPVTTADVPRNHLERQKLAVMSATLMDGDDPERQRKFDALSAARSDDERQRAIADLADAEVRRADRERAFYVDPTDAGWSRPVANFSRERAERVIVDALNDYRVQHDPENRRLIYSGRRPGLHEALEAWTEKPPLPAPPEPQGAGLI